LEYFMRQNRQSNLNRTAVGIGSALGRVAAKVDRLKRQRHEIAKEIQQVIGAAQQMLADLGGRPGAAAAAPRKRKLSAEARERIAEAQRRRWARVRAAKNKK
jgi:hypothetical protein